MGLIKAAGTAVTGALADQWQEIIEASDMGATTVFTSGEKVNKGSNTKGRSDVISNGSVIRVYPNQFMMLVDGGKVIDYTAEEGYYTVEDSAMPSLFNGDFGETLKESFLRIKYGGETPRSQKVYFINLQEIKGLKFGTKNPVNYFDSFYNAELFLRTHGTYSIKITDPLRFYEEVVPRNVDQLDITSVNAQFLDEFLEALQSSINQMSADGVRISLVTSKARELGKYMAATLDEEWKQMRGIEIQSVGIASISYDEESTKLIHMRNQGAMLGDPSVREGYVQGAVARGLEAAGSNAAGSMAGFMGMGMGMNAGGGFMGAASNANMQQMQMAQNQAAMQQSQAAVAQSQAAVQQNQTAMQQNQAAAAPQNGQPGSWTCSCGAVNTGNFCPNCGAKRPDNGPWTCSCGSANTGKFCPNCGKPRP